MAAFATFKSGFVFEFHLGTPIKRRLVRPTDWLDVVSVQCDGHELAHACLITGRIVQSRSFTFIGDEARLIFVNWR